MPPEQHLQLAQGQSTNTGILQGLPDAARPCQAGPSPVHSRPPRQEQLCKGAALTQATGPRLRVAAKTPLQNLRPGVIPAPREGR